VFFVEIMVSKIFQGHSAEVRGWMGMVQGFRVRGIVYVNESGEYLVIFKDVNHNQIGIRQGVGEVISDGIGVMERLSYIRNGFALFVWFVSGEVHVPHIIKGEALLRFPFGVSVGAEGGDCAHPWFLN